MRIHISRGTGVGPTEMSAFDQALVHANVANFNLLYLSSILPAHSEVIESEETFKPDGEWGDRLYVVMAQMRSNLRNQEVWAGIGWMQDEETGAGMLVEHEGHTEAEVRADVENSLRAMADNRSRSFGPIHMAITGTKCTNLPVCALVIAVFESESWQRI